MLIDDRLNLPTIAVLTDRIDLDDQLYKTFFSARDYLKCEPIVAESQEDLFNKLNSIKQGGIILTTVGKFDKDTIRLLIRLLFSFKRQFLALTYVFTCDTKTHRKGEILEHLLSVNTPFLFVHLRN